jgi:hypothetical protein
MFFVDPLFFSDSWDEVEPDEENSRRVSDEGAGWAMQAWLGAGSTPSSSLAVSAPASLYARAP